MSTRMRTRGSGLRPRGLILGFSAVLALTAGFVNAVAVLVLAFPVGNVTGVTTQLGMATAEPLLYESSVIVAIIFGFLVGSAASGLVLGPTKALAGPRQALVLILEAALLLLAAAGVEAEVFKAQISAIGVDHTLVQALFAATALGMQNGLTSSFRGMAVRTTHFTGTVTDLGLMLGRSRHEPIEKWKAAVLSVTLLLFLTGGIAGLLAGSRFGGYSLLAPAGTCVAAAIVSLLHSHRRYEHPDDDQDDDPDDDQDDDPDDDKREPDRSEAVSTRA